ncbi:hypothetical protein J6590_038526 [Homalodisca vitripennis]|nr:hypothetical protein J6590_038526 [Homalodisca vitripennis]
MFRLFGSDFQDTIDRVPHEDPSVPEEIPLRTHFLERSELLLVTTAPGVISAFPPRSQHEVADCGVLLDH